MKTKKTQTQQIRQWLEKGHKLTPIQALEKWGCFRLGARINELRNAGMSIDTQFISKAGRTFAQYSIF